MPDKADRRAPTATARQLFRDLFRGRELEAIPFLPYTYQMAARVEQVALLELLGDPGLMVNALLHARTVVGGDAVLTRISLQGQDTGGAVVATDLLRTGTPAISLEATRRLKEIIGRRGVLACQVTGPLSLARTLRGPEKADDFGDENAEAARQAVLQVIKVVGEIQPDMILVAEDEVSPEPAGGAEECSGYLEPLWNTIRYFDAEPLLVVQRIGKKALGRIAGDVGGVVFSGSLAGYELEELALLHGEKGVCFGLPVPGDVFTGRFELLEELLSGVRNIFGRKGVFACTACEIPAETSVDNLKIISNLLKMSSPGV